MIVRDRRHYRYLDHPASPTTRTAEVEARSKRHICAGTRHICAGTPALGFATSSPELMGASAPGLRTMFD